MSDPTITIVQRDADAGYATAKAYDMMRAKVWNSYCAAIHAGNYGRELDRLDYLFSFDHDGRDMYDAQYTTHDRDEYCTTARRTALAEIRKTYPGWTES